MPRYVTYKIFHSKCETIGYISQGFCFHATEMDSVSLTLKGWVLWIIIYQRFTESTRSCRNRLVERGEAERALRSGGHHVGCELLMLMVNGHNHW